MVRRILGFGKCQLCSVLVLLLFFAPTNYVLGQDVTEGTDGTRYAKGRLYMNDNSRIDAKRIVVYDRHLTFVRNGESQRETHQLQDVDILRVTQGNHGLKYALSGGATVGLVAWLSVLQVENDPSPFVERNDVSTSSIVLGAVVAGAVIGGLWGRTKPKWKTVHFNSQAAVIRSVQFAVLANTDRVGLSVTLSR